jgi:hypothetical protein
MKRSVTDEFDRLGAIVMTALEHAIEVSGLTREPTDAEVAEIIDRVTTQIAERMYQAAVAGYRKTATSLREQESAFARRNYKRWKGAFELLQAFVSGSAELGEPWMKRLLKNDGVLRHKLDVLTTNHAKAILISKEILCLMENGFADGALARWRSLHEVAVVMSVLGLGDEDMSRRYKASWHVQALKAMRQYREHQGRANLEPVSDDDMEMLRRTSEEALQEFGEDLKFEYGWAASLTGIPKATLVDLEQRVGLDHWRPRVKWASHYIHAGYKWPLSYLGLAETRERMLLAGQSNSGFIDPGHQTAISLCICNAAYFGLDSTPAAVAVMKCFGMIVDNIGTLLVEAERTQPTSPRQIRG